MVGKTISHYNITEKIGEGGMGEVYLADDTKLKRQVAIKFLPEHLTKDKENIERFEREAEAAAALNHPNIVTIYDVLEEDSQLCIVMEYVDGKSLRDVINEYKLGLDKIIDIISQLSEGLSKAHKAGIVHRDIKPENIIVGKDARVRILDFGLAKLKGVSKLTKETSTLGTIHYMSPEQLQGKEVDYRSDIWSFGVVMYELLTGEQPFSGDYEQAVSYAIVSENLIPMFDKDTPEELVRIIEKCLAKNSDDRYQNVDEIKDDLRFLKKESSVKLTRKIHSDKKRYLKIAIPVLVAIIAVVVLFFVAQEAESTPPVPIAVVDFINETGENELDGLSGMLTTALEQSRRLSVITRSRMFDILKQLDKQNIDYIDENLGREIAIHANIKVLVIATIRKFDQMYNIDLKVIDPIQDKYLFADKVDGEGKAKISPMIDQLAENTREGLEESTEEIRQSSKPVAELTTPNLEAYQHYFKGQEYIDRIMFEEAETEFEKAIELDSTFGLAYYRLAYAINWESDPQRARVPINKAFRYIENIPDKEKYLVRFVKTSIDSGWGEAALKILKEMEKIYPNDKELIYNIGDICSHIGDNEESIKYLNRVLEIDTKSIRTLQHLCGVYSGLGDYTQMLTVAKKYVIYSGDFDSYRRISYAYIKLNDIDSGINELNNHLKQYPQRKYKIYTGLAFLNFEKGESKKAFDLLNECLKECDEEKLTNLVKTACPLAGAPKNSHEEFEQFVRFALIKYPENINLLYILGKPLAKLKKYEELERVYNKVKRNKINISLTNYLNVLNWLGWISYRQGDYEHAEDNFKEYVKNAPEEAQDKENVLYRLSSTSLRLRKIEQAEYYVKMIKQDKINNIRLAKIYFSQGKYDRAMDQAKKALLLDSSFAWTHETLSYLYAMQEQFDEADLSAKRAVHFSNHYYIHNLIAWILIISDKDVDHGIKMALDSLATRSDYFINDIKNYKGFYAKIPVFKIGEYVIGLGYLKKGDYNQAVKYLEKAHQLLPHREEIKSNLEKAKKQLANKN